MLHRTLQIENIKSVHKNGVQYIARYDSFVYANNADINFGYNYIGSLTSSPYVRILWDSDNAVSSLQSFSETIRIAKSELGETYYYYVRNWNYGSGSNQWTTSGIKAYIWKWSGTKPVLVAVVPPPSGSSGEYWAVSEINGSTVTILNYTYDF